MNRGNQPLGNNEYLTLSVFGIDGNGLDLPAEKEIVNNDIGNLSAISLDSFGSSQGNGNWTGILLDEVHVGVMDNLSNKHRIFSMGADP